jgi:growth factor-regulated tyrosine kinase substrate
MRDSDTGPSSQFLAKPSTTSNGSSQQQPRFQDQYYIVNVGDTEQHAAEHADPSGVAVVTPDGNIDDQLEEASEQGYSNGSGRDYRLYRPNEEQMLLRRMWESREVAVEGD